MKWRDTVKAPEAMSSAGQETLDALEELFPMAQLRSMSALARYVDVLTVWLDEARYLGLINIRERCREIGPQLSMCFPRYELIDPR